MSFRVCCDEHVPPRTVDYLEKDGHEAVHVRDVLEPGVDDDSIATFCTGSEYVLLTNDTDFLDSSTYPELSVLYYGNSDTPAYDLATAIAEVATYVNSTENLPRTTFL